MVKHFLFSENQDVEINRLKEEYANLQPLELPNGITVIFEGDFNMVDGKTLNKMTDNNCTQRCPYCHLLPREYMKKGVDGYEFSAKAMEAFEDLIFCPLHFGLRTWDNLMRLSCLLKLDTPAPRVYGERNHLMFECQKLLIQERCAREKGLLVDIPTGKGGTSTDGNVVRKLFKDPEFLSDVLGLPLHFIKKIINVWIAIRAPLKYCPKKFKNYCKEVFTLYETLFPWAEMCPTLHRVLAHGWIILEKFPETMTLAMISEEGLEHNNKWIRDFVLRRAFHSSRKRRLLDVMKRLMDRSDPIILSKVVARRKTKVHESEYPPEVLALQKDEILEKEKMDTN